MARSDEIKDCWARIRPEAMRFFDHKGTSFRSYLRPPPAFDPSLSSPWAAVDVETIVFDHLIDHSGTVAALVSVGRVAHRAPACNIDVTETDAKRALQAIAKPIPYKVVCEGVTVEEGLYPVSVP